MSNGPKPVDPALREELVAYLDGELDAQECRRIEALLAGDADVRRAIQGLDRTWQMLDELEPAAVGEDFTRTTLEMTAVAAAADAAATERIVPRRRRFRWLLAGGGVAAAALAGFLAVTALTPDPNRQVLRDLPLLENLDQYRRVDSIEFLRMLQEEKLFTEEGDDG
jgi:anti-sigma factor RsiW